MTSSTQDQQKPLSKKPLGYFLTVLGGTLGGPIGWIVSPVVMVILNNIMKEKDGKHPNRFLVWGLIGIIGAPISLAPIIGNSSTPTNTAGNTEQSTPKPEDTTGVNMANYSKIKTGMTYEEVVAILGKQGEEMTSNDIAGIKNIMYKWDGDSGFGANMNAMFQDGKLVSKAQFGLN